MALSPMMRQYLDIKSKYKDEILFFRLGDFYEMFYDDAKTVSRELELVLTGKDCGEEERAPMCGVPFHAADGYIEKLVKRGYKVVICEQTEDPALAKGLVRRDVVRMVTPGTIIDNSFLDESKNNYLASVYITAGGPAVAFADVSTGEIFATEAGVEDYADFIVTELGKYSPKEVLSNCLGGGIPEIYAFIKDRLGAVYNGGMEEYFRPEFALEMLKRLDSSLVPAEVTESVSLSCATGALVKYISETQKVEVPIIKGIAVYSESQFMQMDLNTRRNLELCESLRTKEKKGSLLWALDYTKTSMGARMLRKFIEQPLISEKAIVRRQDAVEEFYSSFMTRETLSDMLKGVLDIERLLTKVEYGSANARDLKAIGNTLKILPDVKDLLSSCTSGELRRVESTIDTLEEIEKLISDAISDTPPFTVREGGMIREGYNAELDSLRDIMQNGKQYIKNIEESEREKTGIKTLKVGYNKVFGYYIEVSKSFVNDVPAEYIRKQTLTTGERFITDELKKLESTVLGASDRINALEYGIFCSIRDAVGAEAGRIRKSAEALALTDCYLSLATAAVKNGYVRPDIDYGDTIDIRGGRHPVVEKFINDGTFVPNDAYLDSKNNRLLLITGPNMAGKSTYMRQVALITLMAQTGSFVPASSASLCVVDKLFTRVGASDDLASGQSTFMLEMNEVAYILKNATPRSLIIFDEIGRGTSTFDGMSIAKATAEYTLSGKVGAKTLFATHYHELTSMEGEREGVVNYSIAAKKKGDDIIFLRKIVRGGADDSYGIEVAKLAGIPDEVIRRAKKILHSLEKNSTALLDTSAEDNEEDEITFDDIRDDQIRKRLEKTDPNLLTPLEALNLVSELKKMLD